MDDGDGWIIMCDTALPSLSCSPSPFFSATFDAGVSMANSKDGQGQQYLSPQDAIEKNMTDIIIVGRGIIRVSHLLMHIPYTDFVGVVLPLQLCCSTSEAIVTWYCIKW